VLYKQLHTAVPENTVWKKNAIIIRKRLQSRKEKVTLCVLFVIVASFDLLSRSAVACSEIAKITVYSFREICAQRTEGTCLEWKRCEVEVNIKTCPK
jgi:hypothetical protein